MAPVAVIVAVEGATTAETIEATARQTHRVRVVEVAELGQVPDGEWVWLLDAGVVPDADALERLLATANATDYALTASKVLAPDGTLDPSSAPVPEVHKAERVVSALARKQVALRVARRGSLLVRRDALEASGGLANFDRDLEWTARLLADYPGVLEPKSIAVRVAGDVQPTPPIDALRLLAALDPKERLWFAAHLAEQSLATRRAG